ncbi:uncharacterized protein LOC129776363 [Toxorhynchites rutilus septentrionalis]|uniref:uncharacterized protein LOC129776363 n=1 Tax=Toxorhynchites rutilus septentrionalis TaxID=329112 RepID=UPI0024790D4E|nr:uncharacterized protein LOC129776363 [Toxorhynchites rutilus septentrionalis]
MALNGARLHVQESEERTARTIPIRTNQVKFGSHISNNIRLRTKLSERLHCKIFAKNEKVFIANYSVENPVSVNGKIISRRDNLNNGDTVEIFGMKYRWEFDETKLSCLPGKAKKLDPAVSSKHAKKRLTHVVRKKQSIGEKFSSGGSGKKTGGKRVSTFILPKTNKQFLKNLRKRLTVHSIHGNSCTPEEIHDEEGNDESEEDSETGMKTPMCESPQKSDAAIESENEELFFTPEMNKENAETVMGKQSAKAVKLKLQNSAMIILSYTPTIDTRSTANVQKTPISTHKKFTPTVRTSYLTPKNENVKVGVTPTPTISKAGNSMYLIDLTTPNSGHNSFAFSPASSNRSLSCSQGPSVGLIDLTTPSPKALASLNCNKKNLLKSTPRCASKMHPISATKDSPVRRIDLITPSPRTPVANSNNGKKVLLKSALKNASRTPRSVKKTHVVNAADLPNITSTKTVPTIRIEEKISTPIAPVMSSRTPVNISKSKLRKEVNTPTGTMSSLNSIPSKQPSTPEVSSDKFLDAKTDENSVVTPDEIFDSLVGKRSITKTYSRKSDSPKKTPSPLVIVEGSDELPKTDIDLWVESAVANVASAGMLDIESVMMKPNRTTQIRSSQYSDITPHDSFVDESKEIPNKDAVPVTRDSILNEIDMMSDKPRIQTNSNRMSYMSSTDRCKYVENKRRTVGHLSSNAYHRLTVSPVTKLSIKNRNVLSHEGTKSADELEPGTNETEHLCLSGSEDEPNERPEKSVESSPRINVSSLKETRKFIGNALTSLNTSISRADTTADINDSLLSTDPDHDDHDEHVELPNDKYNLTDLSIQPATVVATELETNFDSPTSRYSRTTFISSTPAVEAVASEESGNCFESRTESSLKNTFTPTRKNNAQSVYAAGLSRSMIPMGSIPAITPIKPVDGSSSSLKTHLLRTETCTADESSVNLTSENDEMVHHDASHSKNAKLHNSHDMSTTTTGKVESSYRTTSIIPSGDHTREECISGSSFIENSTANDSNEKDDALASDSRLHNDDDRHQTSKYLTVIMPLRVSEEGTKELTATDDEKQLSDDADKQSSSDKLTDAVDDQQFEKTESSENETKKSDQIGCDQDCDLLENTADISLHRVEPKDSTNISNESVSFCLRTSSILDESVGPADSAPGTIKSSVADSDQTNVLAERSPLNDSSLTVPEVLRGTQPLSEELELEAPLSSVTSSTTQQDISDIQGTDEDAIKASQHSSTGESVSINTVIEESGAEVEHIIDNQLHESKSDTTLDSETRYEKLTPQSPQSRSQPCLEESVIETRLSSATIDKAYDHSTVETPSKYSVVHNGSLTPQCDVSDMQEKLDITADAIETFEPCSMDENNYTRTTDERCEELDELKSDAMFRPSRNSADNSNTSVAQHDISDVREEHKITAHAIIISEDENDDTRATDESKTEGKHMVDSRLDESKSEAKLGLVKKDENLTSQLRTQPCPEESTKEPSSVALPSVTIDESCEKLSIGMSSRSSLENSNNSTTQHNISDICGDHETTINVTKTSEHSSKDKNDDVKTTDESSTEDKHMTDSLLNESKSATKQYLENRDENSAAQCDVQTTEEHKNHEKSLSENMTFLGSEQKPTIGSTEVDTMDSGSPEKNAESTTDARCGEISVESSVEAGELTDDVNIANSKGSTDKVICADPLMGTSNSELPCSELDRKVPTRLLTRRSVAHGLIRNKTVSASQQNRRNTISSLLRNETRSSEINKKQKQCRLFGSTLNEEARTEEENCARSQNVNILDEISASNPGKALTVDVPGVVEEEGTKAPQLHTKQPLAESTIEPRLSSVTIDKTCEQSSIGIFSKNSDENSNTSITQHDISDTYGEHETIADAIKTFKHSPEGKSYDRMTTDESCTEGKDNIESHLDVSKPDTKLELGGQVAEIIPQLRRESRLEEPSIEPQLSSVTCDESCERSSVGISSTNSAENSNTSKTQNDISDIHGEHGTTIDAIKNLEQSSKDKNNDKITMDESCAEGKHINDSQLDESKPGMKLDLEKRNEKVTLQFCEEPCLEKPSREPRFSSVTSNKSCEQSSVETSLRCSVGNSNASNTHHDMSDICGEHETTAGAVKTSEHSSEVKNDDKMTTDENCTEEKHLIDNQMDESTLYTDLEERNEKVPSLFRRESRLGEPAIEPQLSSMTIDESSEKSSVGASSRNSVENNSTSTTQHDISDIHGEHETTVDTNKTLEHSSEDKSDDKMTADESCAEGNHSIDNRMDESTPETEHDLGERDEKVTPREEPAIEPRLSSGNIDQSLAEISVANSAEFSNTSTTQNDVSKIRGDLKITADTIESSEYSSENDDMTATDGSSTNDKQMIDILLDKSELNLGNDDEKLMPRCVETENFSNRSSSNSNTPEKLEDNFTEMGPAKGNNESFKVIKPDSEVQPSVPNILVEATIDDKGTPTNNTRVVCTTLPTLCYEKQLSKNQSKMEMNSHLPEREELVPSETAATPELQNFTEEKPVDEDPEPKHDIALESDREMMLEHIGNHHTTEVDDVSFELSSQMSHNTTTTVTENSNSCAEKCLTSAVSTEVAGLDRVMDDSEIVDLKAGESSNATEAIVVMESTPAETTNVGPCSTNLYSDDNKSNETNTTAAQCDVQTTEEHKNHEKSLSENMTFLGSEQKPTIGSTEVDTMDSGSSEKNAESTTDARCGKISVESSVEAGELTDDVNIANSKGSTDKVICADPLMGTSNSELPCSELDRKVPTRLLTRRSVAHGLIRNTTVSASQQNRRNTISSLLRNETRSSEINKKQKQCRLFRSTLNEEARTEEENCARSQNVDILDEISASNPGKALTVDVPGVVEEEGTKSVDNRVENQDAEQPMNLDGNYDKQISMCEERDISNVLESNKPSSSGLTLKKTFNEEVIESIIETTHSETASLSIACDQSIPSETISDESPTETTTRKLHILPENIESSSKSEELVTTTNETEYAEVKDIDVHAKAGVSEEINDSKNGHNDMIPKLTRDELSENRTAVELACDVATLTEQDTIPVSPRDMKPIGSVTDHSVSQMADSVDSDTKTPKQSMKNDVTNIDQLRETVENEASYAPLITKPNDSLLNSADTNSEKDCKATTKEEHKPADTDKSTTEQKEPPESFYISESAKAITAEPIENAQTDSSPSSETPLESRQMNDVSMSTLSEFDIPESIEQPLQNTLEVNEMPIMDKSSQNADESTTEGKFVTSVDHTNGKEDNDPISINEESASESTDVKLALGTSLETNYLPNSDLNTSTKNENDPGNEVSPSENMSTSLSTEQVSMSILCEHEIPKNAQNIREESEKPVSRKSLQDANESTNVDYSSQTNNTLKNIQQSVQPDQEVSDEQTMNESTIGDASVPFFDHTHQEEDCNELHPNEDITSATIGKHKKNDSGNTPEKMKSLDSSNILESARNDRTENDNFPSLEDTSASLSAGHVSMPAMSEPVISNNTHDTLGVRNKSVPNKSLQNENESSCINNSLAVEVAFKASTYDMHSVQDSKEKNTTDNIDVSLENTDESSSQIMKPHEVPLSSETSETPNHTQLDKIDPPSGSISAAEDVNESPTLIKIEQSLKSPKKIGKKTETAHNIDQTSEITTPVKECEKSDESCTPSYVRKSPERPIQTNSNCTSVQKEIDLLNHIAERVTSLEHEIDAFNETVDITNSSQPIFETSASSSTDHEDNNTKYDMATTESTVEFKTPTMVPSKRRLYTKTDPEDITPESRKSIPMRPISNDEYIHIIENPTKSAGSEDKKNRSDSSKDDSIETVQERKVNPTRASRRKIVTLSEEVLAGPSPELKFVKPKPKHVSEIKSDVVLKIQSAENSTKTDVPLDQDLQSVIGRRKVMFNEHIQIKEINSPSIVGDIIQNVARGRGRKAKQTKPLARIHKKDVEDGSLEEDMNSEENAVSTTTNEPTSKQSSDGNQNSATNSDSGEQDSSHTSGDANETSEPPAKRARQGTRRQKTEKVETVVRQTRTRSTKAKLPSEDNASNGTPTTEHGKTDDLQEDVPNNDSSSKKEDDIKNSTVLDEDEPLLKRPRRGASKVDPKHNPCAKPKENSLDIEDIKRSDSENSKLTELPTDDSDQSQNMKAKSVQKNKSTRRGRALPSKIQPTKSDKPHDVADEAHKHTHETICNQDEDTIETASFTTTIVRKCETNKIEDSLNESHMVRLMLPSSHTSTPLPKSPEPVLLAAAGKGRTRKPRKIVNPTIVALVEEATVRRSPRGNRTPEIVERNESANVGKSETPKTRRQVDKKDESLQVENPPNELPNVVEDSSEKETKVKATRTRKNQSKQTAEKPAPKRGRGKVKTEEASLPSSETITASMDEITDTDVSNTKETKPKLTRTRTVQTKPADDVEVPKRTRGKVNTSTEKTKHPSSEVITESIKEMSESDVSSTTKVKSTRTRRKQTKPTDEIQAPKRRRGEAIASAEESKPPPSETATESIQEIDETDVSSTKEKKGKSTRTRKNQLKPTAEIHAPKRRKGKTNVSTEETNLASTETTTETNKVKISSLTNDKLEKPQDSDIDKESSHSDNLPARAHRGLKNKEIPEKTTTAAKRSRKVKNTTDTEEESEEQQPVKKKRATRKTPATKKELAYTEESQPVNGEESKTEDTIETKQRRPTRSRK